MKNKCMVLGLGILLLCTMTACTDQTIPAVETPASETPAAETAAPQATAAESPDATEDGAEISGSIRSFTGGYLTIITDEADSRILEFNLNEAQLECKNGILAGDTVTVSYEGTIKDNNTGNATVTKVTDQKGKDKLESQVMVAVISDLSTNILTVTDTEGDSYSFVTTGASYDCTNGLEPGNWVAVTYLGELKISTAKNIKVLSVTDTSDEITAAQETAEVAELSKKISTKEYARIYSSYSADSDVLAIIPADTQLDQTGETATGWKRIKYDEKDAYIFQSHLNTVSPSKSAAQHSPMELELDPEESQMRVCITSLDNSLITVTSEEDKSTYVFDSGKAALNMTYGPLEGSEINVTYIGKAGRHPEESQVLAITDVNPEIVNEETGGFSVTGTVMAYGPNNITVMSNDGAQITCTTEALQEESGKDFSEGDYVTIIIKPNSRSNVHEALEISSVY